MQPLRATQRSSETDTDAKSTFTSESAPMPPSSGCDVSASPWMLGTETGSGASDGTSNDPATTPIPTMRSDSSQASR